MLLCKIPPPKGILPDIPTWGSFEEQSKTFSEGHSDLNTRFHTCHECCGRTPTWVYTRWSPCPQEFCAWKIILGLGLPPSTSGFSCVDFLWAWTRRKVEIKGDIIEQGAQAQAQAQRNSKPKEFRTSNWYHLDSEYEGLIQF